MKKIVYTITKLNKEGNTKISGQGYITDNDIICACISKKGTPYVRVFEDAVNYCYKCVATEDQYKGAYSEIISTENRDIEVNYFIWYRVVAE